MAVIRCKNSALRPAQLGSPKRETAERVFTDLCNMALMLADREFGVYLASNPAHRLTAQHISDIRKSIRVTG